MTTDDELRRLAEAARDTEAACRANRTDETWEAARAAVCAMAAALDHPVIIDLLDRLRDADAKRVPAGWKLVPVEATQAMVEAWMEGLPTGDPYAAARADWAAMLTASPVLPPWCSCNNAPAEVGACCDHMQEPKA